MMPSIDAGPDFKNAGWNSGGITIDKGNTQLIETFLFLSDDFPGLLKRLLPPVVWEFRRIEQILYCADPEETRYDYRLFLLFWYLKDVWKVSVLYGLLF